MDVKLAEEVFYLFRDRIVDQDITNNELERIKRIVVKKQINYKQYYDYYMSKDNLIKHRKYTDDMRKSLKRAISRLDLTDKEIKMIIDRHSEVINITKSKGKYAVKVRRFDELFGQRDVEKTHLLCAEYLNDGSKYKQYLKSNTDNISREDFIEDDIPENF